jgi:uncharacterized membrane protein YraQ (UPF0718 family)
MFTNKREVGRLYCWLFIGVLTSGIMHMIISKKNLVFVLNNFRRFFIFLDKLASYTVEGKTNYTTYYLNQ